MIGKLSSTNARRAQFTTWCKVHVLHSAQKVKHTQSKQKSILFNSIFMLFCNRDFILFFYMFPIRYMVCIVVVKIY